MLKHSALAVIGIAAVALIIRLPVVFTPVFFALLLAYILEPVITYMDRHHTRRVFTVSFVYTLFVVLLAGAGILIGPPLIEQGKDFISMVKEKGDEYDINIAMLSDDTETNGESENASESWWARLWSSDDETEGSSGGGSESSSSGGEENGEGDMESEEAEVAKEDHPVEKLIKQNSSVLNEKIPILALGGLRALITGAGTVATLVTQFVLALFYAFFFMLHFPAIKKACARWIPRSKRGEVYDVLGEIDEVVAGFFRGRLLVCVIAAVVSSTGLLLSGIEYWLLLGTAAGFLGLIPFIGVALTLIPALLIALTSEQSMWSVLGVLTTFGVVEGIVEPLVAPFVISNKVRLHPVSVTIAFMAGAALFGFLGIFLAIPACGILKILARRYLVPALRSLPVYNTP